MDTILRIRDFLTDWGGVASAAGLLVTIVGLYWAIRRAGQARTAAKAAQTAAEDTYGSIGNTLARVDIQRAVDSIQRLKTLHRESKWELAVESYRDLRSMLVEIKSRLRDLSPDLNNAFQKAITEVILMENHIDEALHESRIPDTPGFNPKLNAIQSDLEHAAAALGLTDSLGGTENG